MMAKGVTNEVREIVRNLPGCTAADIITLMPHVKPVDVHRCVYSQAASGRFQRTGRPYRYTLSDGAPVKPKAIPLTSNVIRDLEARITELLAWKNAAIARFPDLGVDPIVLEARRIAAQAAPDQAADIAAGRRDGSAIIRALVIALTERSL